MDHNASPVDLESLLWDMRDLVRNLSHVAKAQAAEIERLGGRVVPVSLDSEAILATCDTVLAQWAEAESDGASTHYEPYDVAAWVKNIARFDDSGARFAQDVEPIQDVEEKVPSTEINLSGNADVTVPTEVPSDFWNVHTFKWEDEPLVLDEQIPELWLDGSDDSSSNSGSSTARDDGATLFHPDDQIAALKAALVDIVQPTDKTTGFATARRHTVMGKLQLAHPDDDTLDTDNISTLKVHRPLNTRSISFDSFDSDSEDEDAPLHSPAAPRAPARRPLSFPRRLSAPELPRWRFALTLHDDHARED